MDDEKQMEKDTDKLRYDENGDPIFRLPDTSIPELHGCPEGLPEPMKPKYRHLSRQYLLLEDLWDVQLGDEKHRHFWNIQAAHQFWRENGPKTYEGRTIGWTDNWIEEALDRTTDQIDELEELAKRISEVPGGDKPVMDRSKLKWKRKRDGILEKEEEKGKEKEKEKGDKRDGMVGHGKVGIVGDKASDLEDEVRSAKRPDCEQSPVLDGGEVQSDGKQRRAGTKFCPKTPSPCREECPN